MAGSCLRHPEIVARRAVLSEPKGDTARGGRRRLTYVDMLRTDTGLYQHT